MSICIAKGEYLARAVGHAKGCARNADSRCNEEVIDVRNAAEVDRGDRAGPVEKIGVLASRERLSEREILCVYRAVRADQAVFLGELPRKGHVAAPVGEVGAEQRTDALLSRILPGGAPSLDVDVHALVVLLEDDVDGAGDGIRAVDRRTADRDRLDGGDQLGRNDVEVDLATGRCDAADGGRVRRHEAAAVDEGQRALRAEREQINETLRDPVGRLHVAAVRRNAERGHGGQRLADVGEAALIYRCRGNHGRGLEAFEIGTRDARTGDHDLLQRIDRRRVVLGFGLFLRLGRETGSETDGDQRWQEMSRAARPDSTGEKAHHDYGTPLAALLSSRHLSTAKSTCRVLCTKLTRGAAREAPGNVT